MSLEEQLKLLNLDTPEPMIALYKLLDFNRSLPKQRSEEWYARRKFSIGASIWGSLGEGSKEVVRLIQDKIGLGVPFTGNIHTHFGTVMEAVIQEYIEFKLNTSICELASLPGVIDIQTCSPDGIGMICFRDDIKYDERIELKDYLSDKCNPRPVLFEFKCPTMRTPNGSMSMKYFAQCKVGAETVPLVHHVLFAEGVFKRCVLKDLCYNDRYTPFIRYSYLGDKPIALGMIILRVKDDRYTDDILDLVRDYNGNEYLEELIDFGDSNSNMFEKVLGYIIDGKLSCEHINIYQQDSFDVDAMCQKINQESSLFTSNDQPTTTIKVGRAIGIIPWKLFDIHYIPIKRTPDFVKSSEPLARMVMELVGEYGEIPIEERAVRFKEDKSNIIELIKPLLRSSPTSTFNWPNPPVSSVDAPQKVSSYRGNNNRKLATIYKSLW
jgi:hypothetical protein